VGERETVCVSCVSSVWGLRAVVRLVCFL